MSEINLPSLGTTATMAETQIRVLSLNCWGLKYVAKHRSERIKAIGEALANSSYDIIALQELWVYSDYEYVRSKVAQITPHAKFFHSGALGSGLALFSRFSIMSATVHPYSLNGSPIDVLGGDWFVGKAAVSILVAHPTLGQLQVFNTHLYAKGGEAGPEHHRAHRLVNAWEFAKLTRHAAELGRYVIAAGDYNSVPDSFPMTLIKEHAGLKDSWAHTHPNVPQSVSHNMPHFEALHTFGLTADNMHNSYSAAKPLTDYAIKFSGKRLDYVLYRHPMSSLAPKASQTPVLECKESNVVFTDLVPGQSFSYSDHFGLEATFQIHLEDNYNVDPSHSQDQLGTPTSTTAHNLSPASITTIIQALTACYRFSRARSKLYLTTFVACIGLIIALIISSAWLPYAWINPIYILLTTAVAWFATTMLYAGFIYGNWEVNALVNIIEELEIHRNSFGKD